MGRHIFKFTGSPVPIVLMENTKRGFTYKLPTNLLQPKELLRVKLKNRTNAAKLAEETKRSQAIEAERQRRERLESQARFAALLRAERERQAAQPVALLSAFEANNEGTAAVPKRGPGVRGASVSLPSPRPLFPSNLFRPVARGPTAGPAPVSLLGNGTSTRTVRKANLLRLERAVAKLQGSASNGPTGKFWKKEGTNNSNSD